MKKILSIMLLACICFLDIEPTLAQNAVDSNGLAAAPDVIVTEITREEYIQALMECEGMNYEEAVAEIPEHKLRSSDEVIKYAVVEKYAGNVTNNDDYVRRIVFAARATYVYNKALKKVVSIDELRAPYAYIDMLVDGDVMLEHGEIDVQRDTTTATKWSMLMLGHVVYVDPGFSVSVGGNILGVSRDVGGWRVTTDLLELEVFVTGEDLE